MSNNSVLNVSSNSASNEQRRNKKRKPPNYYQSAEYAAIIKHADDLVQQQQLLQIAQNSSINQTSENNLSSVTQGGESSAPSPLVSPTQQTASKIETKTTSEATSNKNGMFNFYFSNF